MEFFWGNENEETKSSQQQSSIAHMFDSPTPETRKVTQVTGFAPPSAILGEARARREINTCKTEAKNIPKSLVRDFSKGTRNAAACLNEFCQLQRFNCKYTETDPSKPFDIYGRYNFAITAIVNGVKYRAGEGKNKKEAKVQAAKHALNELLGLNPDGDDNARSGSQVVDTYGRSVSLHNKNEASASSLQPREPIQPIPKPIYVQKRNFLPAPGKNKALDALKKRGGQLHEKIGALAEEKINQLLKDDGALCASAKHGTMAAFIIVRSGQPGEVVAVGTGDGCCEGNDLNCNGDMLFDCHAESIARRSFKRYLCRELERWYKGSEEQQESSIFEKVEEESSLLCLKDSVTVHLFMNRCPKGCARVQMKESELNHHGNKFNLAYLQNFGCDAVQVPSDFPVVITAGDVLSVEKKRMVTMSGTDKIMKWNCCGVQGSILSLFMEPICLSSITIGFDVDIAQVQALHIGVNRRVDEELTRSLPDMFIVNHIHKIAPYQLKEPNTLVPFFEDTEHLSINWSKGDDDIEVVDMNTGRMEIKYQAENLDRSSRLCKAQFYKQCMEISTVSSLAILDQMENYYVAKQSAQGYQETKRLLVAHVIDRGFGKWISRPKRVDYFKM